MLQNRIEALREARKNGESGFTLIEMLIVIIVLGILAGIVVFGVGTFRQDALDAAECADVKTVTVATDGYNAKNGTWPTMAQLVTDGYLKSAPTGVTTVGGVVTPDVATACP